AVLDSNGCAASITLQVSEPDPIIVTEDVIDAQCNGEASGSIGLSIVGGTPPYSIAWSDDVITDGGRTDLLAGTYDYVLTDSLGCTVAGSATVGQPSGITVDIETRDVMCNGDNDGSISLTVTGGNPPYTYLWSNDAVTEEIVGLEAGIYSVIITDANDCSFTTQDITINEPAALVCNVDIVQESANGNDGILHAQVAGGTPPYTYAWDDPAGSTTQTIEMLSPGTYTLTVSDANNCTTICSATLDPFSMIGDFVFLDMDRDGIQDPDEDGISGVRVILESFNGVVRDTLFTDTNGFYDFRVMSGSYRLTFTNPGGLSVSPANQGGDDELDSDIDENTLQTEFFLLAEEEVNLSIDAGFFDPCQPQLTSAGMIGFTQELCGPGNIPNELVEIAPYTGGGIGEINYVWMKTTGDPSLPIINHWSPIPNSNTPNYQPGPIYQTTYFARCIRQDECPFLESNIITVQVGDDANAEIDGPNLVCESETVTYTALGVSEFAIIDWQVTGPANYVENGNTITITWTSFGAFSISLSVQENGCTASRVLTVNVGSQDGICGENPNNGLGAKSSQTRNGAFGALARIYPNPSEDGIVSLDLLRSLDENDAPVELELYSGEGKLIAIQQILPGRRSVVLHTFQGRPGGLYLVRVRQSGESETHRLIIR
ncbi:MAG: SdrD B-like domain-containing protein, partial [Bacteroidota bacterium]